MDPRRHLGVRLALVSASTMLLLSGVLSLLAGYISRLQLQKSVEQSLYELAFQMADKLDRGMFERFRDLQILAQLRPIQDTTTPATELQSLLEKLQVTYPDYAWIGLAQPDGKVIASTGGLLVGANVAQRPWFQGALTGPFVGDVHEAVLLAQILPNPTAEPLRFVDVAVPVYRSDSVDDQTESSQTRLVRVVGAHLSWQWAEEIQRSLLEPMAQHSSVEIFILDSNGEILLKPDGVSEPAAFLPDAAIQMDPQSGQMRVPINSPAYLTGIARTQGYRDYPGLGWQVLVRQPKAVALAPAATLQWQMLGVGLLLGVGTAGILGL